MKKLILFVIASFFLSTTLCYGWSCKTHTFIADQAGTKNPEYACIPYKVRLENYNLTIPFNSNTLFGDFFLHFSSVHWCYFLRKCFYASENYLKRFKHNSDNTLPAAPDSSFLIVYKPEYPM